MRGSNKNTYTHAYSAHNTLLMMMMINFPLFLAHTQTHKTQKQRVRVLKKSPTLTPVPGLSSAVAVSTTLTVVFARLVLLIRLLSDTMMMM